MAEHTDVTGSRNNSIAASIKYYLNNSVESTLIPWLLALPALLVVLLYRFIPVIYNFYLSFHSLSFTGEMTYVGLKNYVTAVNDPVFTKSIIHTIILLGTIPVGIVIALGIALLLNRRFIGSTIFRGLFFIPYVTMMVAIAVVWQYMFKTNSGVLNYLLLELGVVSEPISWLSDTTMALVSVFIVMVWKTVGFYMVILLSGLQTIPQQVYEVSRIDGANPWQRFRYVTLPLLKPTIGICMLVGVTTTFRAFDLINTMLPNGGPNHGAEILLTWSYKQAFKYAHFGYGAVNSIVLFLLMVVFVLIGRTIQTRQFA